MFAKYRFALVAAAVLSTFGTANGRRPQRVSFYPPADEAWPTRPARTFIAGSSAGLEEMVSLREELIAAGARRVNLFLPDNVIVCELPASRDLSRLIHAAGAIRIPEREVGRHAPSDDGRRAAWIRDAYAIADRAAAEQAAVRSAMDIDVDLPAHTVEKVGAQRAKAIQDAVLRRRSDLVARYAALGRAVPRVDQTSELLTGNILVEAIYPESNGVGQPQVETWTDEELGKAVSLVTAGMLDYQGQFSSMRINLVIHHHRRVDCRYEPVESQPSTWIPDVMRALGYGLGAGGALETVHDFNLDRMAGFRTDWVFTAFVIRAKSRSFRYYTLPDGPSTAVWGGGYNITHYPIDYDPQRIGEDLMFMQIFQHQVAHLFWAVDEYPTVNADCTQEYGYLAYPNENVTSVGPAGAVRLCERDILPCMMYSSALFEHSRPHCKWTMGHIGVIDNDPANGVPDVFEAKPVIEFQVAGPETTEVGHIVLNFKGVSRAVPNANPDQHPDLRTDYAVPLQDGVYSLGGIDQTPLTPVDGKWDEAVEDFRLSFDKLPVGPTLLEFRVRSNAGQASAWYQKFIHYIGINYAHLSIYSLQNGIDVSWKTVGETWGARFDLYRMAEGETEWTKIAADVTPGTPQSGFTPYRYFDRDVLPGKDYRYYVQAEFTLVVDGQTKTYRPPSNEVSTTAMIPVSGGSILSPAAPNPFRSEVSISVLVPKTFETKSATSSSGAPITYEQRVATPVDVAVYDVLGRRVRALVKTAEFIDVITLKWDGRDAAGRQVPVGVYFIKAEAGEELGTRKVLLVR